MDGSETMAQLEIPTELEFLEFFGAEPIETRGTDGFWCYEVTDRNRVTLRLSFNVLERSVQTTLLFSGGCCIGSESRSG